MKIKMKKTKWEKINTRLRKKTVRKMKLVKIMTKKIKLENKKLK